MDLIEKGVHYANSKGDIPVFYPEASTPANGYRFVKWHVEGTDYKEYSRDQILSFRARVANALFIPPEYVLIAGVQPSSSLLIALMIPESYVELFQMMLERDDEFLALQRLGVDVVEVGRKSYNLKGIADAELVETEQQSRLTTIYEQLEEKVKNLEKTEVEVVTLSRKVDNLQEELKGNENKIKLLNVEVKTLRKVLKPNANNPVVSEILEKAMDNFKSVLDEVEKTNYDKTLIVKLLDTNTELVSVGGAHSLAIKERGYNHEIARLNAMITPLQYKLARYQYATAGGPPEFDPATDKAFLNVLQTMIFSAIPGVGSFNQTLTPVGEEILKNISMGLKQRDRKTILKNYTWHPNDPIKARMDDDSSWFLAGIFYKELEKHGNGEIIDFGQFYASLLSDIGRADLKEKFVQQHPEHKQKKNVPYPDQAAAGQTPTASQQPTEFKQMKQQIADMHTWMESARQGFRGESESWSVPAFDIPQSFKGNDRTGATEETKPRTQSEKDKA
ncbi:uncharacterized protein LOC128238489 isoform X2 [Mya arenaria]|nr:uncharacterized protein LOC128238489 isoform X2 [Mya arenaria]